jgi:hypothetical protein
MKFLKYAALLLVIFGAGFGAVYIISGKQKPEVVSTISPTILIATSQPTPAFSLENAPSESLRGQITEMKGNIDWQGRTATEAAKISIPITIQQGENLITEEGSSLSLNFPGACSLNFSEKTEIDIIQTLPADMVFSQASGAAEYSKTGSYPIDIRSSALLTELTGEATISRNPQKPVVTVFVKSGSAVVAYNDLKYISHEVTINAGQTYTFNYGTRKGVAK